MNEWVNSLFSYVIFLTINDIIDVEYENINHAVWLPCHGNLYGFIEFATLECIVSTVLLG